MRNAFKKYYLLLSILLVLGCATQKAKYANEVKNIESRSDKPVHSFYLIGDAGKSPSDGMNNTLSLFKTELSKADKNSTAIFLGDNIYPAGLPKKSAQPDAYKKAKHQLDAQLETLENFKGNPIFIPGNHDWYSNGLEGLERQEKYIEKKLESKKVFYPRSGCPIDKINVSNDIVILAIDTEWFLTDWDKHPEINKDCEIKSREKFFEELEGLIKKNASKTTLIALHHPMFSYGVHGGQFTAKQQLYPAKAKIPMPILGSVASVLRKTGGVSIADMNNKHYGKLKGRLVTLAQYSEKVILVSGHEHSLQYIVENNTPQIVSGSGAKNGATRLMNGSKFSYGGKGFAKLDVFKDGSSQVRFYGADAKGNKTEIFATEVLSVDKKSTQKAYGNQFSGTTKAAVYTDEEVEKSGFFKSVWGERYRKYYGTKVSAPNVNLDTLFGGLTPIRKGGGHQSKSLRLKNKEGKEYVMRALRKSAELYLQSMAFKEQYIVGDFENTFTDKILMDFYTGAHPYAPFTIGDLSDAVGIYHTNPTLYYIPKQDALGGYNDHFGDELYMIEERVSSGHGDQSSFGNANEIISTDDLIKKLRKDDDNKVDAKLYLRSRLFDMAIGDWDRHTDQWRWAEFDQGKKTVYRPIPRDRDQAFSIMSDGALLNIATRIVPGLRIMEGFQENIRNVKGYNSSPKTYMLDLLVLKETTLQQWKKELEYLQQNLTEEVIDNAFLNFPEEVRDETVTNIKKTLLKRLGNMNADVEKYYGILNKNSIVTGTDKDDSFTITRMDRGETLVEGHQIKKGKKGELFFSKVFRPRHTKEIWIYGLDDDDEFSVKGDGDAKIKVRLIGGHNNDIYDIQNSKKVVIYDHKTKKNTLKNTKGARVKLTEDYETNTYRPLNVHSSVNQIIPTIGSNPDDGLKIGFVNTYIHNGFRQNPFTSKHTVNANYYFATNGMEYGYAGEFANVFENWNLELETRFTTSNFSENFFGFGNETQNNDEALGMDYNRVKLEQTFIKPSFVWHGYNGAKVKLGASYDIREVDETTDRFVNTFYVANDKEIRKKFLGAHAMYAYENSDNAAFPTLGMALSLEAGYKSSLGDNRQEYSYFIPSLSFDYKLIPSGQLVLATKWKAHFNMGDGFEFYQAATIGANDGPRSYRNQRFSGKKMYYQNTDLRLNLKKIRTRLLPMSLGLYTGFDYGRVWQKNEDSDQWHTSYGGGFFLNAADMLSARLALFYGNDGARLSFGVGFGF